MNTAIRITAITGFLAVALGAIGAHGLQGALKTLPPEQFAKQMAWWNTGAQYHIVHAAAMLALALHAPFAKWAWRLMLAGIVLFSGSLYIMAATGATTLRHLTPIGGFLLLGGWLALLGKTPQRGPHSASN
jgi:uncharacterized membrane protein YgdD (TMEM256/DUF423 family)